MKLGRTDYRQEEVAGVWQVDVEQTIKDLDIHRRFWQWKDNSDWSLLQTEQSTALNFQDFFPLQVDFIWRCFGTEA